MYRPDTSLNRIASKSVGINVFSEGLERCIIVTSIVCSKPPSLHDTD